jgi:hypothetical protein
VSIRGCLSADVIKQVKTYMTWTCIAILLA